MSLKIVLPTGKLGEAPKDQPQNNPGERHSKNTRSVSHGPGIHGLERLTRPFGEGRAQRLSRPKDGQE